MNAPTHCPGCEPPNQERRGFLKQALCIVIGGLVSIVPLAAGLAVFLDPLRKKKAAAETGLIRVTSLNALPDDGIPRKFAVIADKMDAWNKYPQIPVGAVYLRRTKEKVEALNVVCPHAGCFVDFKATLQCYLCPCHNSSFQLDGSRLDKDSPSPRGMDPLTVEIRGSEVWVAFQKFQAGKAERIPEA
jgi:menaquinol-cytochrome c reductase iron-sulfur subunit